MDPRDALDTLGGYATRAALLGEGVTRHGLAVAVSERRVVRLRRGVYALGMPDGMAALRAAAVALKGVVSHDSAAIMWGLEVVHEPRQRITVARNRSRATFDGVVVSRGDVGATVVREGLRVTSVIRTLLDCAAVLALEEAVVVVDSAFRMGLVTPAELSLAARRVRGPHARKVRRVVRLSDPKSESVLESLLRVLLVLSGIAPDQSQFVLRDSSGRIGRVDFVYLRARLIVEADGFEFHSNRADYRRDRRRSNAFCRLDWSLLRFTWEDVRFHPEYVVEAVRFELSKGPRRQRLPRNTQRAA